ncbi:MAG TPA: retropepsin-like aspartic protease [Pirellulales bacterium]|nr:retropepsin-like aspartic protease [Pirellulales bacterium]
MPAYETVGFDPPAAVATVIVREPHSARAAPDVRMLIDSGADVTLLPERSLRQVGIDIDTGESYELIAFDGSVTVTRAVTADMVFLGRNFKGRFLPINDECGVIGRDVLNHLSIQLDGPNLTWNET